MFYKTAEAALRKLSLAIKLEQACRRPRNLAQIVLRCVKTLLVVMRVNLQRSLWVGMAQPVLELLNVPAPVDEHRCTGMTEFVVSNIGTSVSFHGFFKIFRYPARIVPTAIFPCENISFRISICIPKEAFVFVLLLSYG